MNFLIIFSGLLALSSGFYLRVPALESNIGQNCELFPTLSVSSFTISPWPATASATLSCTMEGTFSKAVYVNYLYAGLYFSNTWTYNNITIGQSYQKGDTFTSTFNVQAGSSPGTYKEEITVISNGSKLACWQFSYVL